MNRDLPPIIFVRHGETDWNRQGLIQGSIDTDLNATGRAQAEAVAQALFQLRDELTHYDFIVSPQKRAQETMAAINALQQRPSSEVQTQAVVRELSFGIWEGKTWADVRTSPTFPADPDQHFYWRPEGGESYEDGVTRIERLLGSISRPTLIVAHGGIGRCLMGHLANKSPGEIVSLMDPQGWYCRLHQGQIEWFDASHVAA